MLNIINSYQNKDGYQKSLFHNSNSTNNIKINTKDKNELQTIMNNNYTNIIFNRNKTQNNNEYIIDEKTQNIKLNVYINKDGNEIKQIPLDFIIHNYYDNKNIISIQIIDNNDPLFFYCSKIDEIEYQELKKEQSLFIEYKNFSDFIFKMLNNCLKDNYCCYIIIKKNEEAYFIIEEKTQFKKLNHLTLKLNSFNNLALKDHLNKILNEYKEKCDNLSKQNKELTQNFDKLKDEKKFLENNYEILKKKNEEKIVELINEKEKEINRVYESSIKQKEIIQNYINKNNNLKEEMNQFKLNIEKLNNEKSKLIEENLNSQKSYKEIQEKYIEMKVN